MPPRTNKDTGMLIRLTDQLAVMKSLDKIHKNPRLLEEIAFYPEHDKR